VAFFIAEEVSTTYKHAEAERLGAGAPAEGERFIGAEDDGVGFNVGSVDAHYEQRQPGNREYGGGQN
jgi:hypothetical protein